MYSQKTGYNFSVWLRTGSNPADNNRFRSDTVKNIMDLRMYSQFFIKVILYGQWAVYYASPQSLIITFSYLLAQQLWGLLLNFDWFFIKLSVQTF